MAAGWKAGHDKAQRRGRQRAPWRTWRRCLQRQSVGSLLALEDGTPAGGYGVLRRAEGWAAGAPASRCRQVLTPALLFRERKTIPRLSAMGGGAGSGGSDAAQEQSAWLSLFVAVGCALLLL